MQEFTRVDGASAFVRRKHGVYCQSAVFKRGDNHYIPYGRGFVRIAASFGGRWSTSHPTLTVLELEGI